MYVHCAVWLFGLSPSLDDTLHWKYLVPTDAAQARTLLEWTAPLVSVYALLGSLRAFQNERSPGGIVGTVTQASAFAADKLQAAGRELQYASTSSASDMRIQYFLSTVQSVCVGAPILWGLLPGVVVKVGAPFAVRLPAYVDSAMGTSYSTPQDTLKSCQAVYAILGGDSWARMQPILILHVWIKGVVLFLGRWAVALRAVGKFVPLLSARHMSSGHPRRRCRILIWVQQHINASCANSCIAMQGFLFKGATVPRLIQVPFIALGVAALCGVGNFFNSAASDMVNRDEKRDDTKYVDSLFQVQSPVGQGPGRSRTTIENGRLELFSELGADNASAERALNQIVTPASNGSRVGQVINEVSREPPTSITMDFLSAASKV
jgi:hypothetical protein